MLLPLDLRFVRLLRLIRLFRIFKMTRYSEALQGLSNVVRAKKEELVIALLMVLMMLIFASSLMYFVEFEAQPEMFSSIPATMWWGVTTLTTVGYGDMYPVTPLGKLLGAAVAILGIGIFALPAGIVASGYAEEIQQRQRGQRTCPHCGHALE